MTGITIKAMIRAMVKSKRQKAWEEGREVGHEEGLREGLELTAQKSIEVTEEEYKDLMDYLIKHKLIMCYSINHEDKFSCGLMVRKQSNV